MGWMVKNFVCNDCGHTFEDLYKTGEEDQVECPECEGTNCQLDGISTPAIGVYSMADPSRKAEILKKRSIQHTQKKAIPEWKEKQRAKVKANKK